MKLREIAFIVRSMFRMSDKERQYVIHIVDRVINHPGEL